MKRLLTLFLSVLCMASGLMASLRSEQEALQIAAEFYSAGSSVLRMPARDNNRLQHSWTALQHSGQPAFYVFNRGTDEGFVIVSAEESTHTIIGYSETGHLDEESMPSNMRAWLKHYTDAIELAGAHALHSDPQQMVSHRLRQKTYTPVAPICTTRWGQGNPYNQSCPYDNGGQCVTGCVATAAAQLMKVHNHPVQGTGSHSYMWKYSDTDSTELSANFGATTYNWSQMLDDYRAVSSTQEQQQAVATLMFHCGVACEMGYTSDESGANSMWMVTGMIDYFGYDRSIRVIALDYMTEEAFVDTVYASLQQGCPLFFSGRTIADEGHAFVCDGIDANGYVHINWGWDGTADAYFRVSLLSPELQGTGGSSYNLAFTENVSAFAYIRPNENGDPVYTITAENMSIREKRLSREREIQFTADTLINMSVTSWTGHPALMVYQNGVLYGQYPFSYFDYGEILPNWGKIRVGVFGYLPSSLPSGTYELVPAMTTDISSTTCQPILVKGIGEYRCQMVVTDDSVFLAAPGESMEGGGYMLTDPATYNFAYMDGYLTNEEDASGTQYHQWKLQLTTSNFYAGTSSNEAVLMFTVYSSLDNSLLGSYLADGDDGHLCAVAVLFEGNSGSFVKSISEGSECTVYYNSVLQQYIVRYNIPTATGAYVGQVAFPVEMVFGYNSTDNKYTPVNLSKYAYAALSTTQAAAYAGRLTPNVPSAIPYVVAGEISQLVNTPEQIMTYGNCRLYITDGTTPLYGFNTRWYNNTSYPTGNELAVGGKGVIVGPLEKYNNTVEIYQGFFCHYLAPGEEQKPDPIVYDAEDTDFIVNFADCHIVTDELAEKGLIRVWAFDARNDSAYIYISFSMPQNAKGLTAGVYPIQASGEPNTVVAGTLMNNTVYNTYAAYLNGEGYLYIPLWYPIAGTVEVTDDHIEINATNSYGRQIHCVMIRSSHAVETVNADEQAQKILRNGQICILRNGSVYTLQGIRVND